MFAADGAAPGDDLGKKFIKRGFGMFIGARLVQVHHHVGVDVAIAGVAETRDGQAVLLLQPGGELEQIFQPAARDNDVFVQLGQAGVAEGVGKFAPDFPDFLALRGAEAALDELFAQVIAWGGSISGEHGIGLAKKRWWPLAISREVRGLHRTVKKALDPKGILNPGKFV